MVADSPTTLEPKVDKSEPLMLTVSGFGVEVREKKHCILELERKTVPR